MIYERLSPDEPVRQGDIFVRVPRIDVNLSRLVALSDAGPVKASWNDLETSSDPATIIAAVRPVIAVVISQDCDASRAEDISLCEARPFHEVEGKDKNSADKPKKWARLLTQHARVNQKWFYLPPDEDFSITERMAVDFRIPIRVPRDNIEDMRSTNRVGRLTDVAGAHFRERIGEFFRRYPYDEWYPLSADELREYSSGMSESVEPFPWQRAS